MATSIGTSASKDGSTIPVFPSALLHIYFIMQVMSACFEENAYFHYGRLGWVFFFSGLCEQNGCSPASNYTLVQHG